MALPLPQPVQHESLISFLKQSTFPSNVFILTRAHLEAYLGQMIFPQESSDRKNQNPKPPTNILEKQTNKQTNHTHKKTLRGNVNVYGK